MEKEDGKKELEKIVSRFEERQDEKLKALEDRLVHQFHIISEGVVDQIKLLAEGHAGILDKLKSVDNRLERLENE